MIIARSSQKRGFTLLELILSSGIVAILMLALYTALHTAYKARLAMNAQAEKVRSARVALDLVEQDLRSILPPGGTFAGPFTGTANEIDCYCLSRDYGQDTNPLADGMRLVDVLMDTSGGAPALVQKVTRNLLPAAAVEPTTEIIATNVTAFSARYYDGADWSDSWDSTEQNDTLPKAVEITVTVRPNLPEPAYSLSRTIPLSCATVSDSGGTTIKGF